MAKGGQYERDMCKRLSLWWTHGERSDVFWRSSNSGGRATVRARKGEATFGHCGDVAATDPIGQPLLDVVTLELKRGYSSATFHALLDRERDAAQQTWEEWIQQASEAADRSRSQSWMIIAKRDRREDVVVMDDVIAERLDPLFRKMRSSLSISSRIRYKHKDKGKVTYTVHTHTLFAMLLSDWFRCVTPEHIRDILEELK